MFNMRQLHLTILSFLLLCVFQSNTTIAATLVVDDDGNGGYTTIAAAMAAASGGDIISITGGADNIHQEADIVVTKSLTFKGQGQTVTTIQAAATPGTVNNSVFSVTTLGLTVSFEDMIIKNGYSYPGGIVNTSNGGGVYLLCDASTNVDFTNVTLTDNKANSWGGGVFIGGDNGTVTFTNCVLSNNEANNSSVNAYGGGLCNNGASVLTLIGCTISGNLSGHNGGGIFTLENDSNLKLINCTISNNTVGTGTTHAKGAGLDVRGTNTTHSLINCTIVNNVLSTVAGIRQGAGIYHNGGSLDLTNTIVANNTGASTATNGDDILSTSTFTQITSLVDDCDGSGCPTFSYTDATNIATTATSCGVQSYFSVVGSDAENNGTATGANIPTDDICGTTRSITAPDIGSGEEASIPTGPNALDLDGTDDYVDINAIKDDMGGLTTFTMEFWVKGDKTQVDNESVIIGYTEHVSGSIGTEEQFLLRVDKTDGTFGNTNLNGNSFDGTTDVLDNNWHHVAVSVASGTATVYVDGVLETPEVGSSNPFTASLDFATTNSNWAMGMELDYNPTTVTSQHFNGQLDEVRIWNTARTGAEIAADLNAEINATTTGLLAYYQFNHGTANSTNTGINTLTDVSGNSNDGSLTNFGLTGTSSNWVNGSSFTVPPAATPAVGVGTVEVCHGDNINAPVTIADGDGVATLSFKIAFDNTKLTYVQANNLHASLNNGNLVMTSAANANATGEITVAWYNTTNVNFGAASLFDLEFTGSNVGNSALTWSTTSPYGELSDENGAVISSTYSDGAVTVNALPVVQSFAVQGGGLTGCASAASPLTLELAGSESGVNYQLQKDGVDDGTAVAGTGAALTFNVTAAGSYTVVATNATTNCTEDMNGTIIVTAIPTAFNVTGGGDYCPSGAAIAIGLDGSEIGVNYHLTLNAGTVETVAGTGAAIAFTAVTTTSSSGDVYTVVAEAAANATCTENMTGSATVTLVCFDITGTYRYGTTSGHELKNFTATLKDNSGTTVSTYNVGTDGQFTFTNIMNGTDYYISADLSSKPHGGINAIDALLMARHFANIQTLSSGIYEDAGDVNALAGVNAADALATMTRFVGNSSTFASGDWLTQYDGASTDAATQEFDVSGANVGLSDVLVLAYGDVNGSYNVSGLSNGSKSIINLVLENEIVAEENATINIPFYTMTPMEVGAISIVMNYPYDVFDITSIQLNDNVQANGLHYTIENGRIRLAWFNLAGVQLAAGEELFSISAKVHSDISAAYNWTPTITFGNETELGNKSGQPIEIVDLTAPAIVLPVRTVLQASENFTQHLYPNPASLQTSLEYNLPTDAKVTFELFNTLGTQIRVLATEQQPSGIYTMFINTSDLEAGMYIIRTTVKTETDIQYFNEQLMIAN